MLDCLIIQQTLWHKTCNSHKGWFRTCDYISWLVPAHLVGTVCLHPQLPLVHCRQIDYWQTYGSNRLEHSLHSNCEGKLSACSMGESKLPPSSSCVRAFFALPHCSKIILKSINKTKRRYSIVWGREGVKLWIGLKPQVQKKEKKQLNALKLRIVKEGQLMCFRHLFLWTIWCLSIITCCQELGKGVFLLLNRSTTYRTWCESIRWSLWSHWLSSGTSCGADVISWLCFFLVELILPYFSSMLLTCFGN